MPGNTAAGVLRARTSHDVFGLPIDHLTSAQVVQRADQLIIEGRRGLILNVNAHCINLARALPELRAALLRAHVLHCDGSGVRLAARIIGVPPPPRTSYSEIMPELLRRAGEGGWSLFLLGGTEEAVEEAARQLRRQHPDVRLAGYHHGFLDKHRNSAGTRATVDKINASGADVLIVGFGMPMQELWLHENWHRLHPAVGFAGGAVIDRLAGTAQNAPAWAARMGLEWLVRLLREPRRLARRYLFGLPRFLLAAVALRFRRQWWRTWGRRRGERRIVPVEVAPG